MSGMWFGSLLLKRPCEKLKRMEDKEGADETQGSSSVTPPLRPKI